MGIQSIVLVLSVLCLFSLVAAHSRCATKFGGEEHTIAFEKEMHQHMRQMKRASTGTPFQIRVAYIVVDYDTGAGTNIPDIRLDQQISQFNQAFSGALGGVDTYIRFTRNYTRRVTPSALGLKPLPYDSDYIDARLKPLTSYNPDLYLNFWVVPLEGLTLGYAVFPTFSGLDGLYSGSSPANRDGLVIDPTMVGSNTGANKANTVVSGITAVHEVGHYLGLRHIWGDGQGDENQYDTCGETDYCSDTPPANGPFYGCPATNGRSKTSCPGYPDAMITNYMDYSDDPCLNRFTQCQAGRMQVVLNKSPRRTGVYVGGFVSAASSLVSPLKFLLKLF